jgi:hypothetical protein
VTLAAGVVWITRCSTLDQIYLFDRQLFCGSLCPSITGIRANTLETSTVSGDSAWAGRQLAVASTTHTVLSSSRVMQIPPRFGSQIHPQTADTIRLRQLVRLTHCSISAREYTSTFHPITELLDRTPLD